MENQITYAAYGTNISVAQMAVRFPDARVYGRAELRDHELVFRGSSGSAVATVEPREGGAVPVLLWRLSRRDGRALDIYENWPVLRQKAVLEVQMNSRTVPATVYIMTPGYPSGRPAQHYCDILAEGYRTCGFNPAVLEAALARSQEVEHEHH
jgi:hypothetical protein